VCMCVCLCVCDILIKREVELPPERNVNERPFSAQGEKAKSSRRNVFPSVDIEIRC